LSDSVFVGEVLLSAFGVAGFAAGDEVVEVVVSAAVVLDEVVGFGGWPAFAPVAGGVSVEYFSAVASVLLGVIGVALLGHVVLLLLSMVVGEFPPHPLLARRVAPCS
jgi:hypothetical protein